MEVKTTEIDSLLSEYGFFPLQEMCKEYGIQYDSLASRLRTAKVLSKYYLTANVDKYFFRKEELLATVPVEVFDMPENQIYLSADRIIGCIVSKKFAKWTESQKLFALVLFNPYNAKIRLYVKKAFWQAMDQYEIFTSKEEKILAHMGVIPYAGRRN